MRLAAAAVLALAACTAAPQAYHRPENAYGDALVAATRSVTVRHGLETLLIAYATHDTETFRAARTARLGELAKAPALFAGEPQDPAEGAGGQVFVVAAWADHPEAGDFARPGNLWTLRLDTPSGPVAPVSVRRLESTPTLRALYPYVDAFHAPFRVVFPPSPGPVALVITGPLGEGRMPF